MSPASAPGVLRLEPRGGDMCTPVATRSPLRGIPRGSDRSGRHGIPQKARLIPQEPGLWARLLVRGLVIAAAGVMTLGFLGADAAVLVVVLAVSTYVLLWLRSRCSWGRWLLPPARDRGAAGNEGSDPTDFR